MSTIIPSNLMHICSVLIKYLANLEFLIIPFQKYFLDHFYFEENKIRIMQI
jgi:hypothetical protein